MPADKEEIVSRVAVCLRRAKDISDRKREVEELRLRAEIMKNVAEGIYLIRLDDGIIVYANQKFEKMFGYNPGEMIGKEVSVVNAPTDKTPAERKDEIMDVLVKTGEWHGEVRNIKKDGTPFWCSANVSLADHPDYGRVIVSVHSDITEKKRTEEEAKRGAEQWQKTFDSINDLVFIQDKDYTITRVNQSFAAALKAKPEDLIGKKCYQVLHKLDKPWPECPFTETRKDNQVHNAEIIDPKIGIPLLVTISPIFNDKGELTGSVHIAKDISVMKKAEKELKKKIRDLERFQKVMMNREKRVIELKAEVKELKRRLGEG